MRERFLDATPFSAYLEAVRERRDLWQGVYERAEVPDEVASRIASLSGRWYLLALVEEWCGDGANALPVVARLAESVAGMELRVLSRDENPDLMDAHLTGTNRSIPVVMILDEDFREVGWWGPRPSPLQEWVQAVGMDLDPQERSWHIRRWYARDRGRTTLRELLDAIPSDSPSAIPDYQIPC
jgi:hypothetical protein